MIELYWLTRLEYIKNFLAIMSISGIVTLILLKNLKNTYKMKIVYKTFNSEEKLAELFNQWIANGYNISNKFIRIVHTGDYYTIFHPENLDIKDNGLL